jgi:hypothetical protein
MLYGERSFWVFWKPRGWIGLHSPPAGGRSAEDSAERMLYKQYLAFEWRIESLQKYTPCRALPAELCLTVPP